MSCRTCLVAVLTLAAGCANQDHYFGRACVSDELSTRTGYPLGPAGRACQVIVPDDIHLDGSLTEGEAVLVGLWNNPGFQEVLVDLGVARSDLVQASQFTNPDLSTVLPVGVKQLEFAVMVPLEALWLRKPRLRIAQLESRRVGERLVQFGLNTIRDVRVAYADVLGAVGRWKLADEGARLRMKTAELAEARVRAGEASELEASAARIDALLGRQAAARRRQEVELARQRLQFTLGVEPGELPFDQLEEPAVAPLNDDVEELVHEAVKSRPDVQAARLLIGASQERVGLARWDYLRVMGLLPDANSRGEKGFEASPGFQATLPIFHQNQGARLRLSAELARSRRQLATLEHTVALEVRQAATRFLQAWQERQLWIDEVLPAAEEAAQAARNAYENGGASLLLVLETGRQVLAAQEGLVDSTAALRRAGAELERSVGRVVLTPLDLSGAEMADGEEAQP